MRKRIQALLLSLIMVLSMLSPAFTANVYAEAAEETTTIKHTETTRKDGNYFTFSETGWSAMGQSDEHVWSDNPASADAAADVWYEVKFVGHKIDIYAGKNWPHGRVTYYIDGVEKDTVSLYNGSNINSTFIISYDGLEEGEHTLRAVAVDAGKCIDCAEVIVYHAPYKVTGLTLAEGSVTIAEGATKQITYTTVPDYAALSGISYVSDNENVATVDTAGVITAVAEGTANITLSASNYAETKTIAVTVVESVPGISGSIVDTDTQWTEDRYDEVKNLGVMSKSLTAWKNDKAVSELAIVSVDSALNNVTVTASDFISVENKIAAENITATFIKSTKAYNGSYVGYGNPDRAVPADNGTNRSESSDILYQTVPIDVPYNEVQPVWVEFAIPENAAAGTYTGTLTVNADALDAPLVFNYTVEVQDAVLRDVEDYTFDIMQWQYPYSSAEYYGVTPFSEEHFEIMESSMEIYKEVGGNAITTTFTEEAWSGQTYSANAVHYPSMVKWTMNSDGSFSYDYTDFDKWVSFCKEMGLGDKIVAYGIAPWHGSFTYWTAGAANYTKEGFSAGSTRYNQVWSAFLADFAKHLDAKGWKENVYIGIDERGLNTYAFDLAEAAGLKTASDIDSIADTAKKEIAKRVTALNIGDSAAKKHAAAYEEIMAAREAKGFKTTVYSCTEHVPGQFSLSAPVESYWSVIHAAKMDADGFNRWAYDAWVADPLNDTTHNAFEPGDCFVIFPDEKDAENPTSKYSVRLARMAEGVRDVNKIEQMVAEQPTLASEAETAYANLQYVVTSVGGGRYLNDNEVAQLAAETAAFKEDLNELTERYIALQNPIEIDDSKKVAYYSFDNVTDGNLVNEWADDRNGTIDSSATFAEGKSRNALSVNEAGKGAVIADSSDLDGTDWTVGYWVKTTSDFTTEISVAEDSTQANSLSLKLAADRTNGGFRTGNGSGDVLTYNYTFEPNTWYHLTWTQDKDGAGLALYVNGQHVQSNNWTVSNALKAPIEVIGGTGFTGLIDEVKIFNAVLTEEEIASIMQVPGINLDESSVELYLGDTHKIKATLISENTDRSFTYESADESIATVDEKGLVTAIGRGTTTITVTNAATGYTAELKVKVSVEISILNELTRYTLPEKYQSNVEGAASNEEGTLVGTDRQYLGQPDMVQTETGRLITVFPVGHGHGELVMKISEDNGETWTEKTDIPSSWADSQETPTLYSLQIADEDEEDGFRERLVLICACPAWDKYLGGWQMSYSDDDGDTWTQFEDFHQTVNGSKNYTIVAMASLIQLKDEAGNYIQKWMGVYHNDSFVNYKSYLTFDENGNPEWTAPVPYLSEYRSIESSHQICEVGMFRSPDGERIVALGRNQTHTGPATMFYSDDEGETWSEPVELPGSLAGERHKAKYVPGTEDKLLITFREIDYDRNNNGVWEGGSDWTAGEWVAWVGTYEDIMNLQQGDYMIVLDEDFANNYYSGDTGYTGMAVLEDGTFVLHSYGHWDQAYSSRYVDPSTGGYNVKTDLCWIRQAKFSLAELEAEFGIDGGEVDPDQPDKPEVDAADDSRDISVTLLEATAGNEEALSGSNSTEGPAEFVLDNNTGTMWHTAWAGSDRSENWIQFEVADGYTAAVDGLRYLPRTNAGEQYAFGVITEYRILVSNDGEEWDEVATGTWTNDAQWKIATFDAVEAKYVKLVSVNSVSDNRGAFTSAAEIRLTGEAEETGTEPPQPPVEEEGEVVRIAGKDRYATGYAAAEALKEALGVDKFDAVVVATGKNFADALSGSYLAIVKEAPILLTNGKDDNVAELHAYIKENVNANGTVYILGGSAAVPATVEAIEGYTVKRLAGASRYDTNLEILAEAGITGTELIVATGKEFADSLSASATGRPILLVKPGAALSAEQRAIAETVKGGNIYVVGGTGAVADTTAAELEAYAAVERIAGSGRQETSKKIAEKFFADAKAVVAANAKNFPDGLCGGPLAAAMNAPLLLTATGNTAIAEGYVQGNALTSGVVLGGTGALSDEAVVDVFGLESAGDIVLK